MKISDAEMEAAGFEKRRNLNPRPDGRKTHGWQGPSVFLTIRDGGPWDGCPVFDYAGGNLIILSVDYLVRLEAIITEGHEARRRQA